MATIDIQKVFPVMIEAAKGVFDKKWPEVKDYAEPEFEKLASTLALIETLRFRGKISETEASVLLEMQKNTARAVMLTLEGMSLLLVEAAINAALAVVKDTINTALGFALL
jgi:transcription initiation factor IIE alpha subunit